MLKLNYELIGKEIYNILITSMETENEYDSDIATINFIYNNEQLSFVHWFNNKIPTTVYVISTYDCANLLNKKFRETIIKNKLCLISPVLNLKVPFSFIKTELDSIPNDISNLLCYECYKFGEIIP